MSYDPTASRDYSAMTVNERLHTAGLSAEFDAAVRRRDREAMIGILRRVDMTKEGAAWSTDQILRDPAKYGY